MGAPASEAISADSRPCPAAITLTALRKA